MLVKHEKDIQMAGKGLLKWEYGLVAGLPCKQLRLRRAQHTELCWASGSERFRPAQNGAVTARTPGMPGESIPETYYLMRKEIHNCEENGNNQRNDQNVFEALFAISQAVAFHSQVAKPKQTKNKRN